MCRRRRSLQAAAATHVLDVIGRERAQLDYRCAGRSRRPCRRRETCLRRNRDHVRRTCGCRGGRPRRRARDARNRPAAAGRDNRARRRHRALGRLGIRPRCAGRRAGAGCASADAALSSGLCVVPIVPGAILFDLDQRRRQGLGPLSALSRSRLRGSRQCRPRLRARYGRRRAWCQDRQPQGRARLGVGHDARRRDRRRDRRCQRAWQRDHRRRPAFLGSAVRARR